MVAPRQYTFIFMDIQVSKIFHISLKSLLL